MPVVDSTIRRIRRSGANPGREGSNWNWPFSERNVIGQTVTDDNALGLTGVYRCVTLISTVAAGQPLQVFDETDEDNKKKLKTEDTAYLWRRPNVEMTRQGYWETLIGHEVQGDAFIFVDKDGLDNPIGIWYVEPWRVRVGRLREAVNGLPAGTKVYEVDNYLPMVDYRQGGEIVHVPNWGRGSLRGVNPVKVAAQAIALGLSAEEYALRFFGQDSTPRGLITSDSVLTENQAAELARRWERNNAGLNRVHRTAVMGSGAKFQAISVSPEESQLLEERRFSLGEMARLYGVPPHLVGDTERSTSWGTGIEEQTRGWLAFGLQAHVNRFEQAISDALLVRELTNRYAKFNMNNLLRGATLQRYQAYAMGYGRWLTAADIRDMEEMPPVDGAELLLAASNLVPADQVGQIPPQGGGQGGAAP